LTCYFSQNTSQYAPDRCPGLRRPYQVQEIMSWWNPLEELAKDLQGGFSLDNLQGSDAAAEPQEMQDLSPPQVDSRPSVPSAPPTSSAISNANVNANVSAEFSSVAITATAATDHATAAPEAPRGEEEEDDDDIDRLLPSWAGSAQNTTEATSNGVVGICAGAGAEVEATAARAAVRAVIVKLPEEEKEKEKENGKEDTGVTPANQEAIPANKDAVGSVQHAHTNNDSSSAWEAEKRSLIAAVATAGSDAKSSAAALAMTQRDLLQCQHQLQELQAQSLNWQKDREGMEMQLLSTARDMHAATTDRNANSAPSTPTPGMDMDMFIGATSTPKHGSGKALDEAEAKGELQTEIELLKTLLQKAMEANAVLERGAEAQAAQFKLTFVDLTAGKNDAESKNDQLATKVRDLAKVYAECKKKLQNALTDTATTAESCKTLEADLKALQSKYAETRKNSLSTTETYAEEKRFAEGRISEQEKSIESLKAQVAELQERLRVEKSCLAEAMTESNAIQLQEVKAHAEKALKEYRQKMHSMEEEHSEAQITLQDEVRVLKLQSSTNSDVAQGHEEYKKRAQIALKKANTIVCEKTAEIEALHKELEEVRAELTAALAHSKATAAAFKSAGSEHAIAMSAVSITLETLQRQSVTLEQEKLQWGADKLALQAQVDIVQREVNDLRHAASVAASAVLATPAKASGIHAERAPGADATATATATARGSAEKVLPETPAASSSQRTGLTPLVTPSVTITATGTKAQHGTRVAQSSEEANFNGNGNSNSNSDSLSSESGEAGVRMNRSGQGSPGSPSNASKSHNSSTDNGSSSGSGNLFYAHSLKAEIDELRQHLSSRGLDLEELKRALQLEKALRVKLSAQREELLSYIERSKQAGGEESTVNMEYLKNCTMRYMGTFEISEKKKLFPVIATILKLTKAERDAIEEGFVRQEKFMLADGLSGTLSNISRGFFGKN